jgi:hypothetical protein
MKVARTIFFIILATLRQKKQRRDLIKQKAKRYVPQLQYFFLMVLSFVIFLGGIFMKNQRKSVSLIPHVYKRLYVSLFIVFLFFANTMKTNNILKIVIGLVFTALLASCYPESLHPISEPDKAVIDNRLTGAWAAKMEDELVFIQFLPKSEGKMEIVLVWPKDDEEKTGNRGALYMFPTHIGKHSYMNLKFVVQSNEPCPEEPDNYYLYRYRISKDGKLTIWGLTESAVIAAIKSGLRGEGRIGSVDITADTNELSEYIKKSNPEQMFGDLVGEFYRLIRI